VSSVGRVTRPEIHSATNHTSSGSPSARSTIALNAWNGSNNHGAKPRIAAAIATRMKT
jgi:hypothetical protein